jgi:hypothetical protein
MAEFPTAPSATSTPPPVAMTLSMTVAPIPVPVPVVEVVPPPIEAPAPVAEAPPVELEPISVPAPVGDVGAPPAAGAVPPPIAAVASALPEAPRPAPADLLLVDILVADLKQPPAATAPGRTKPASEPVPDMNAELPLAAEVPEAEPEPEPEPKRDGSGNSTRWLLFGLAGLLGVLALVLVLRRLQ